MWLVATTISDDDIPIITEGSLGQYWARGTEKKTFTAKWLSEKAVHTDQKHSYGQDEECLRVRKQIHLTRVQYLNIIAWKQEL